MTRTLLFICFLFGLFLTSSGQIDNLILTSKQNDNWIDSLAKLSLGKKLTLINERILNDTNVFVNTFYPDGNKAPEKPGNKVYGNGKPTIIINQTPLIIDNLTPNNKAVALTQLLNKNNIADITILKGKDQATVALYGTRGRNGVILMTLTNKKFISNFKSLKLTSNY